MVDMKARAVVSAEDKTAGVFERIAKRMGLISQAAAKANYMSARVSSSSLAQMSARSRAMDRIERSSAARAAVVGAASRIAGPIIGAAALTSATKQFAELDRRITRIGITADAGAGEVKGLGEQIYKLGQEVALPTDKVTSGLEVLVAQGRTLKESMAFLPSVVKTAAATGAEVEDIAKSADAVGNNFKISAGEMQLAFDTMAAGGKAGTFELKEMARYLPSLGPAAAAAGFKGVQGLTDLVAMLQIVRKGTGTSEEAAGSMSNIFQKLESEETQKRFKKFGVDLAGGMAKARKEGKNLVEALEEMTATATKGDLSKIPQLFNDMEFGRGMRAIMAMRGEWQKLSSTIRSTAAGSVDIDLKRVTNDAQAKLDKLAEVVKHRARQIGEVVANIAIPINDKIEEALGGQNPAVNRMNEWATHYDADLIAKEELRTGVKGNYDPDTRRLVDARTEFVQRELIDANRERLDGAIAGKEKILAGRPVRNARIATEQELARLRAERADFNRMVSDVDENLLKQAETAGDLARFKRLRVNTDPTGTIFNRTQAGSAVFGFGPNGEAVAPGPISTQQPPRRPDSLPRAPVTADDLKGLFPAMPDWSKLEAAVKPDQITAKITEPVTAELKGAITSSLTIKVDGPGTVTGMSSSSSSPQVKPSIGVSMPQAGNGSAY